MLDALFIFLCFLHFYRSVWWGILQLLSWRVSYQLLAWCILVPTLTISVLLVDHHCPRNWFPCQGSKCTHDFLVASTSSRWRYPCLLQSRGPLAFFWTEAQTEWRHSYTHQTSLSIWLSMHFLMCSKTSSRKDLESELPISIFSRSIRERKGSAETCN